MKKLFILTIALLSISSIKAQLDFDFSFEKRHIFGDQGDGELVAKGYVKNNSGKTETVTWQVSSTQWNSDWELYVIDKTKQYDPSVNSASFNLADGDSALIELRLNPKMIVFAGEAKILLSRQSDPFDLIEDAVKFSVHTLGVRRDVKATENTFEVYPNPSTSLVSISLETEKTIEVKIYDALGKLVITHMYSPEQKEINVESLDGGIYFISYTDDNGNIISQQFQKK